jgi:cysteinyl-tRNA synthetase
LAKKADHRAWGDRSLIAARERARMDKNWQEADRIRDELSSKGVVIEDTPGGTVWKVK